ncbi:unnamed protein product [Candidula unifasciata]|uniref:Cell cycle checkpoint protein RAD17 n=1 Tax=Candidula unifasciata TaxID=100452 RepID=A0A8S3ZLI7_9EUPU|nr:unnamed protein product [Candidula unifasciata]
MDTAALDDDDVQIVKVSPSKKPVTWVSSSFDDFGFESLSSQKSFSAPKTSVKSTNQERKGFTVSQSSIYKFATENKSLKRPRQQHVQQSSQYFSSPTAKLLKPAVSLELWSEKHKPLSRADLALHKKKIEVVADWLAQNSENVTKHKAPILLLTGPPGAGKTACIHVLCTELGIDIQEWSCNAEQSADQWSDGSFQAGERSSVDVYMSQSQTSLFHNFLLRANKYQALDLSTSLPSLVKQPSTELNSKTTRKKCAVVVEDLPNIFFRDAQKFHEILRNYRYSGHCPLVFIISDTNNSSGSIQKLFPKDLQCQLNITNISVNPVAPTVLIKLLQGIVNKETRESKWTAPNAAVIEAIASSSCGDIRSAINTLQFACRTDTSDLKALYPASATAKRKNKSSSTKSRSESGSGASKENSQSGSSHGLLGAKDTSVFLFHAVGKILYFKRGDPKEHPNHENLPPHLKEYDRDPLLCVPEDVVFKSNLSGDYFNSFLHENYVEFLSSVEDLERAAQYFSDADYLSSVWTAREELQKYSVSVATRGYIHSNSEFSRHDSSGRKMGWKPLHKSQWFDVSKQASANVTSARQLFKGYHWEPEVLCTEILPFISVTNPTLHDTGQIAFVQEMTQFSQRKAVFRPHSERLDERDVIADAENSVDLKTSFRISIRNAKCYK